MQSIEDLYDENPLDMKISEHIKLQKNHQDYKFEGEYTTGELFNSNDLGDLIPDIYQNKNALPLLKALYLNSTILQSQYSSFNSMYKTLCDSETKNFDPAKYDKYCQIINELSDSYTDNPFDLAKFKKIFRFISMKDD